MKSKICYLYFVVLCIMLPFTLTIGNSLLITYSPATYQNLLFQNKDLTLSQVDRKNLADSFYQGITRQKSVQVILETGKPAFSEKEITHMKDVAGLIKKLAFLFIFLLLISGLLLFWLHKKRIRLLSFVPFVSILISLLALMLILIYFESSFTLFHRVSFQNDFWLLDPNKDLLINLFPFSFFVTQFTKISTMSILELALLFFTLRVQKNEYT